MPAGLDLADAPTLCETQEERDELRMLIIRAHGAKLEAQEKAEREQIPWRVFGGCTGKSKFASYRQANDTLRRDKMRRETTVYRCQMCGFFHVGSRETTATKRRGFYLRRRQSRSD